MERHDEDDRDAARTIERRDMPRCGDDRRRCPRGYIVAVPGCPCHRAHDRGQARGARVASRGAHAPPAGLAPWAHTRARVAGAPSAILPLMHATRALVQTMAVLLLERSCSALVRSP